MFIYNPTIQNQIIEICGNIISEQIVERVNSSKCFVALADETNDVSGIEQMAHVRCEDLEDHKIREYFLMFVPVFDLTGLVNLITSNLRLLNIDCEVLISLGYDRAAAVSSQVQDHTMTWFYLLHATLFFPRIKLLQIFTTL